jgi:hypothetical protein
MRHQGLPQLESLLVLLLQLPLQLLDLVLLDLQYLLELFGPLERELSQLELLLLLEPSETLKFLLGGCLMIHF